MIDEQTSESAKLLRLMSWLSPAFPVGAFSYSHGLEQAIADGVLTNRVSLQEWLEALIGHGSGWIDAVLFSQAWRIHSEGEAITELAELGTALAPGKERQKETLALGQAFLAAVADVQEIPTGLNVSQTPYPVAVGALCGHMGIDLVQALAAFLQAFSSNLIGVAQRAIPLGQKDAVHLLLALEPLHAQTASKAEKSCIDDLGSAAFLSDIAAMRHEQLQPRIFRT